VNRAAPDGRARPGSGLRLRAVAAFLALWGAFASGCAKNESPAAPPPVPYDVPSTGTPATGPFQATGWVDASGKPVLADDELAAKTRCAQRIVEASTDQIHTVPARDIDDCLVKMGWKKAAQK
jgi:hypothetical protein